MTALENMLMLLDTLHIFESYRELYEEPPMIEFMGRECRLSYEEYMQKIRNCKVLLPEDIEKMKSSHSDQKQDKIDMCEISCRDMDTFLAAHEIYNENAVYEEVGGELLPISCEGILVLNFANPYIPGGGVRKGAKAQEEDLCRKSSLLFTLESEEAKKYYQYNIENRNQDLFGNDYGTNSMILSPEIHVVKDKFGERLEHSFSVGVLTAAAPIIRNKENISDEYLDLFYERIYSVLLVAAHYKYKHLVLGAWGCGAFGNDAKTVVSLFKDTIANFTYDGKNVHKLFKSITFAVPYNAKRPANYEAFNEQFRILKKFDEEI